MQKTITVSDLSGDVINPGEGVKIQITDLSNGSKRELDAHRHEVEGLFNQARPITKRRYTRKAVVAE